MFDFPESRVAVRRDISIAIRRAFQFLASPGGSLSGTERVSLARAARSGHSSDPLERLAAHLYSSPATVDEAAARSVADLVGDPPVVEAVGVVARLSCVDRFCQVIGVDQLPLPEPVTAPPTGDIAPGLKRRRAHVPMPPGPIPVALDLVPAEGKALRAMFGPFYMTEEQMADPNFARHPGLDTAQLEIVAARVSLVNRCFY